MHNLKAAFRSLVKSPGFTLVAVLTLALGIGANTAIFSAVHALLIRPLPFADAEQLVEVQTLVKREQWEPRSTSVPDFQDYRAGARAALDDLAAVQSGLQYNLTGEGDPLRVTGEIVSDNYFSLLRVAPVLGRTFTAEENTTPGAHPLVVLAHDFWQARFLGRPDVLGRQITLNDVAYTVIGVMPPGFTGLDSATQFWLPLAMAPRSSWTERGQRWHAMIGRLRPGASLPQANTELEAIGARLAGQFANSNANYKAEARPLRDSFFGDLRQPLLVLMGAVGLVLLITCANVANLLLVRLTARRREIAVRASLGASRGQLGALFLAESLLLGAAGGVLALFCATWFIALLQTLNPVNLPAFVRIELSWPVFAFSSLATLACALGVGAIPGFLAARTDLNASLKDAARGSAGGGAGRMRQALVFTEVALSLGLLITAALFLRSFVNLVDQHPGYRTTQVAFQPLRLPPQRYNGAAVRQFGPQLQERAAALPGVAVAALATDTPLDNSSSAAFATVEGEAATAAENELRVYHHGVTPEYFTALGVTIVEGANFAAHYAPDAPVVAIVSESFARRYWAPGEAVGKRFKIGRSASNSPWMQIIGVAADTKHRGLVRNPTNDPDIYVPFSVRASPNFTLLVQTRGDSAAVLADLRGLVRQLDANLPAFEVTTIEQRVAASSANQRFSAGLMGGFAASALLLAALGLYGVVSHGVAQRTREIGVRMALGATPGDVFRLIVGGTGRLVAAGLAAGIALTLAVAPLFAGLLFQVGPRDPLTYAGIAALLAVVGLVSAWAPARRATKVDPVVALRAE